MGIIAPGAADGKPKIPRRTLQRDLKKLLDVGIVIEKGETHQRRYSFKASEL